MATQQSSTKRSFPGLIIVGIVLVISLMIAGLFLPPVSLGERLGLTGQEEQVADDTGAPSTAAVATDVEGITLHVEQGAGNVAVSAATPTDDSVQPLVAAIPQGSQLQSDLFVLDQESTAQGQISLAIPADAASVETTDLYGWDGTTWAFIPGQVEADQFVSAVVPLPDAVALIETAAPSTPAIGAELLPAQSLPAAVLPHLTEVTVGTLTLGENGQLVGDIVEVPTGGYKQLLRVTNTGVVVDQVSLAALLSDDALLAQHVGDLVAAAAPYAGLNLDYQGVPVGQRETFSRFVADLAEALQANGKTLAVTLGTPASPEPGVWMTEGQNWQTIGQAADAVYVQMPLNPAAYAEQGLAQRLVEWATRQINRHKLTLLVSANAVDAIGGTYRELPNTMALDNFGELNLVQGTPEVEPGTAVEVGLAGSASPLAWDEQSTMYRYTYEQAGQEHNVWLNNEAAVSRRMLLALPYHVRGVAVRGLGDLVEGEGYAQAIASYVSAEAAPEPAGAAIVWTVEDEAEQVVASNTGEALTYRWEDTDSPGRYTINAVFAQGDAVAKLGTVAIEVQPPANEPAAEPEQEPETSPVAAQPSTDDEASPTPATGEATAPAATPTPPPSSYTPGDADAVVNSPLNFRTGPGISYGVIETLGAGTKVTLIGRTNAADWFQVQLADNPEKEGWLFGNYLTINSSVDRNALAVVEVAPPAGSSGGTASSGGGAPPAPIANTGFELGGQAFGAPYGQMQYAGMTWIKRQHKWSNGNTGQEVAGMISEAHNGGFKILLSIPGAQHSSIDYGAYVNFLRAVASLPDPPDAIEIWNEMNIDREWPSGQISAQTYVQNMLAPAYQAIKGANPNIMVVSGAPAPTGFFGGCGGGGCDDGLYMAQMAAAGGANYMDCIGIHYNEGIISPNQESGDPRTHHYTRYFWGMTNTYYNAFGGSRPLCYTELGYLTSEGYGGLPGGFSWAGNVTVAQQAQWLAEAASLSASSGKVRMMIVWNVDSKTWGADPQAGYAIIRPDGSCPACESLRRVMGR